MTKTQLIDAIQQVNRSARAEWLEGFDLKALRTYLDHLELTLEPRGKDSHWVRRGETPAIISR